MNIYIYSWHDVFVSLILSPKKNFIVHASTFSFVYVPTENCIICIINHLYYSVFKIRRKKISSVSFSICYKYLFILNKKYLKFKLIIYVHD